MFLYKIVKQSHQRLYKPGMMSPPFFVLNQIQFKTLLLIFIVKKVKKKDSSNLYKALNFFSTRKVDNLRLQTIREL